MTRANNLVFANWAIKTLPAMARWEGQFRAGQGIAPAHWELRVHGLLIVLAEEVLLAPNEPALSSVLDVWPEGGNKVLSVTWSPARPWQPPNILTVKAGGWQEALGWAN